MKTGKLCASHVKPPLRKNLMFILYMDWMNNPYSTTTFLVEPSENFTMFTPFCGTLMRRPSAA